MFTCWLCIDCLLNTWNLADQFSKLLSNGTEVLVLSFAEIAFQNEGVLPVVAQGP
jgi:hypothetical protein